MTVTLYGIKNCDTVRAARKWLDSQGVDYQFHDIREAPLPESQFSQWSAKLGPALVNKRSTTWKQLSEADKAKADTQPGALLQAHPTLMKRPLLDTGKAVHLGFKDADYQQIFTLHTL